MEPNNLTRRPRADRPDLSIVVASFSGEKRLGDCLRSIEPQRADCETVIATCARPESVCRLRQAFPWARFVVSPAPVDVFSLRSLGVAEAQGSTIALTEDHCRLSPQWSGAYLQAARAGHPVCAGPVENGDGRGVYGWALYFLEYASLMPPLPAHGSPIISAVNAAYDRGALLGCRRVWQEGFYDNEVHDALRAAGHPAHLVQDAWVQSDLNLGLREAMSHLFAGGRRFGGYRSARCSRLGRAAWLTAVPLIPAVLLRRIAGHIARRRPARLLALMLALPYVACLLSAWCAGEAVGLAAGPARNGEPR